MEEAIRPGGISMIKSVGADPRHLDRDRAGGGISLDGLAAETVPKAQARLLALAGVGHKTAACALVFALGMCDVPLDTHVSRVGTRLGLLRDGTGFIELHDAMLALTAGGRARAAPEPAPARPPDLSRPTPPGSARLGACAQARRR